MICFPSFVTTDIYVLACRDQLWLPLTTKLVNQTHIFHGPLVRCMKGLNANDKVFLHIARILSCKTRRKDKGSMRTAAIVGFILKSVRGSVAIFRGVRESHTFLQPAVWQGKACVIFFFEKLEQQIFPPSCRLMKSRLPKLSCQLHTEQLLQHGEATQQQCQGTKMKALFCQHRCDTTIPDCSSSHTSQCGPQPLSLIRKHHEQSQLYMTNITQEIGHASLKYMDSLEVSIECC